MMKNQIKIGIISIIVVIALILSVILVIFSSNNDNGCKVGNGGTLDSRFFGEWLTDYGVTFDLKSNGSLYEYLPAKSLDFEYLGIWEVRGDQICFIVSEGEDCSRFEFSDNDKTLTFYIDINNPLQVWTKQ